MSRWDNGWLTIKHSPIDDDGHVTLAPIKHHTTDLRTMEPSGRLSTRWSWICAGCSLLAGAGAFLLYLLKGL